jgi:hypothetical protein
VIALLLALAGQGAVEQGKIDAAVKKGVEWLKKAPSPGFSYGKIDASDELILLTLIHAGLPESDPRVQELLKGILERPLERTYLVTLQAMCLEEIDRAKFQSRIAQCAQFLVDNQLATGQWSYGTPTPFAKDVPPPKDVASGGRKDAGVIDFSGGGEKKKPKITRKIPVKKMRDGSGEGDNSNTMYAALGLRACFDAGIVLPKEVVELARKWFIECQHPATSNDVASGDGAAPRGWCYNRKDVCAKKHGAYGGMTAGAAGAMVIYNYILGTDWRKDPSVKSGHAWLAVNFKPNENPGENELGGPKTELYYTLYAVERYGMLAGHTLIGNKDWYVEGASFLLSAQKESGGWDDGVGRSTSTWDTCFAILFLKKATRALVASEDTSKRSPK